MRYEVAGEVVGHAAASTLTDIPKVFRAPRPVPSKRKS